MMNVEIIEQLEHAFEGLDIMEQDVQLVFVILDGTDENIYCDVKKIAGKFNFMTQCYRADNVHQMKRFRKDLHVQFDKKLNGVYNII